MGDVINKEIESEDELIHKSRYISRDLSWLKFNYRVLEQAKKPMRTIWEKLKFLAITDSNLDEFLMIRVGSLYNYLDFDKKRIDYCGLREIPFKNRLFSEVHSFTSQQNDLYVNELSPEFQKNGFEIKNFADLDLSELRKVNLYFSKTIYPMLTPFIYDIFHPFPILNNRVLILGVVTKSEEKSESRKFSFVQIPQNLPRFFEIEKGKSTVFIPIEQIVKHNIDKLYQNTKIMSVTLFRVTRNGDFDYDDYDESEVDFVEEIQKKLKKRKTGRVVRLQIEGEHSKKLLKLLKEKLDVQDENIFFSKGLIDYTSLWQLVGHKAFSDKIPSSPSPVLPLGCEDKDYCDDLFDYLKNKDLFLHHPYNSMEPVLQLLEQAAEDPNVLAIKITIYRLAKDSRVAEALLKAAENGKHVSVLFEVKARFDEENNINQGQRLQKAGCYVVYGINKLKTHTKLLLIVRKENKNVRTYVHMSTGNYNESTAKLYTDIGMLSSKRVYGNDVADFFNAITGHSFPDRYKKLVTAPNELRNKLVRNIRKEASNARRGLTSGIIIKVNSLEDREVIDELYKASNAGVTIKLIVRGICCLRPGRKGLSENITVKSIVGDFLEHSRIFYFHNNNVPKVYVGSADVMVRSFDKRIESIFVMEGFQMKQDMHILDLSLKDEVNSFELKENGDFESEEITDKSLNCHKEFYDVKAEDIENVELF